MVNDACYGNLKNKVRKKNNPDKETNKLLYLFFVIKKIKENVEEDCKLFLNGNLKLATELKLDGCHMPENAEVNKIDLDQKIGRIMFKNPKYFYKKGNDLSSLKDSICIPIVNKNKRIIDFEYKLNNYC